MKRKRLLCAAMALILLFSVQPTAAALTSNQRSTVITVKTRLPVIRVAVPGKASVYINPLQFPVSIGDGESTEQIISTPAALANYSEVPMAVDVTVAGEVKAGSTMTVSPTPTGGAGTDKRAFFYFEMQQAGPECAEAPERVEWDSGYDAAKHLVIVPGTPATKQNILTLSARTLDGELAEGGYAPFRLTGDAVKNPTNPWNSKDGINVTVAFTFTPLSYPVS